MIDLVVAILIATGIQALLAPMLRSLKDRRRRRRPVIDDSALRFSLLELDR